MRDALLEILEGNGRVQNREPIRVNGHNPTFNLGTEKIEARALRSLDERTEDLVEISACIFAADTGIKRGGDTRPDFGERWRRRFRLTIPVHDPDFWSHPDVMEAVVSTASFVSDDYFQFAFEQRIDPQGRQGFLQFDPVSDAARQIDEVILFSGGLDSLTGALETLATTNKRVALVTRRSANKLHAQQDRLVSALAERFPDRLVHVPVTAQRVGSDSKERTQRTRSFLFTAIAYAIASSLGAKIIRFFENGVVSHQLPISEQVIGTMATRTTHPFSMRLLDRLLKTIDADVDLSNPYQWMTKAQVLDRLRSHGGADLLKNTISCSSVYTATKLHTHCGRCSQCLDRRFAVLASDLADHEPPEIYETDVLTGERHDIKSMTMALDWTEHARRLSVMTDVEFMERFGGEVARICEGFPGESVSVTAKRVLDLQRLHGQAVRNVLNKAIAGSAALVEQGRLRPDSLLGAFISKQTSGAGLEPRPAAIQVPGVPPLDVVGTHPVGEEPPAFDSVAFPLRVRFSSSGDDRPWVEVVDLGCVHGAPSLVAHKLRPAWEEDVMEGRSPDEHQFVTAGNLADLTGSSKSVVTQNVKRCRAELADFYQAIHGVSPARDILIENRRQYGYRLDPAAQILP